MSNAVGAQRIELARGITSEQNRPRSQILDREARCIKFNRNRIIVSKSTNGSGGRKGHGTSVRNTKWSAIADDNMSRIRRDGTTRRNTRVVRHVGRGAGVEELVTAVSITCRGRGLAMERGVEIGHRFERDLLLLAWGGHHHGLWWSARSDAGSMWRAPGSRRNLPHLDNTHPGRRRAPLSGRRRRRGWCRSGIPVRLAIVVFALLFVIVVGLSRRGSRRRRWS
jgi:hypothetical protein